MEKKIVWRKNEIEPTIREGGRQSRLMIAPKNSPVQGVAMGYQIMPPGSISTPHTHETEQEVFFVMQGHGHARVGDQEFDIEPEMSWVACPPLEHGIWNTGDEDLIFVWCYCPPLASQK